MPAINDTTKLTLDGRVAVITVNSPPVNALSLSVREGIFAGIKAAVEESDAQAIVLTCRGETFSAGEDLHALEQIGVSPTLSEIAQLIESSSKPVIAAVHGNALGGGFELALACHYRVAAGSARCGLSQVKLGLVPSAGGTQRLPRLIGVQRALDIAAGGESVGAEECLTLGIVDALVDEFDLVGNAVEFANRVVAEHRPLRKIRDEDMRTARGHERLFSEFRHRHAEEFRGRSAPEVNIRCIQAAANLPFDEGLAIERSCFDKLIGDSQSAALRHVFFAERELWKIPDVGGHTPIIPVHSVGIMGTGKLGIEFAARARLVGVSVTVVETDRAADTTALAACDFILCDVPTSPDARTRTLVRLHETCKSGAILAVRTFGDDFDALARASSRPESVIGLHTLPLSLRTVEIVRGTETSKAVIATTLQTLKRLGQLGALVRAQTGLVVHRMLARCMAAASSLLSLGVAPAEIDRAFMEFGWNNGPFQLAQSAELEASAPADFLAAQGSGKQALSEAAIVERCIRPLVAEGLRLLEEGVALRASDIDMLWVHGMGWPAYRGGPMWHAEWHATQHALPAGAASN